MYPPQQLMMQSLLLWLLRAPTGDAKPPCPAQQPCQCTDVRIKCIQHEHQVQHPLLHKPQALALYYLDRVPYFQPMSRAEIRWSFSYHELRIRGHAMTNLSLRYDWGVLSVRRVEVTDSLVRRIQPGAFRGLQGVEVLNLSRNLLASLGSGDLADLTSLRELALHDNRIKTLQPGLFRRHSALLTKLYLSANLLTEVPPDIRQLTGLRHLYLQNNNISRLEDFAFNGLRRLIILDLGGLRPGLDIGRFAFCGLAPILPQEDDGGGGGLVALYLRDNSLLRLDLCALGSARGLRGLNLTGARFPCGCHAASLGLPRAWPALYGFSPLYVAYEAWQVADCGPERLPHCDRQPACPACPDQPPPPPLAASALHPRSSSGGLRGFEFSSSSRRQAVTADDWGPDPGSSQAAAAAGIGQQRGRLLALLALELVAVHYVLLGL